MFSRKLGRLFGVTLAAVAFAALAISVSSGEFGVGGFQTAEVEWGAPVFQAHVS